MPTMSLSCDLIKANWEQDVGEVGSHSSYSLTNRRSSQVSTGVVYNVPARKLDIDGAHNRIYEHAVRHLQRRLPIGLITTRNGS